MNDTAYVKFLRAVLEETNKELERVSKRMDKALVEMRKTNSVYKEVNDLITPESIIGGQDGKRISKN